MTVLPDHTLFQEQESPRLVSIALQGLILLWEQESQRFVLSVLPGHMPRQQQELLPLARLVPQEPIVLRQVPRFWLTVLTALPGHIPFQEQE